MDPDFEERVWWVVITKWRVAVVLKIVFPWDTALLIRIKLQVFKLKANNNKNYSNSSNVIDKLTGNCME